MVIANLVQGFLSLLTRRLLLLLVALPVVLLAGHVQAHEVRPGYIKLKEIEPLVFDLQWRQPILSGTASADSLGLAPILPEHCQQIGGNQYQRRANDFTQRTRIRCSQPLTGQSIGVVGLERTITNVFVNIELLAGDNSSLTMQLTPQSPVAEIDTIAGSIQAIQYLHLGVEHMLTGLDHILFVLGLLLLALRWQTLLVLITAFTVAHSLTLAAAAFAILRLPSAPVEIAIALSVLFVAVEAGLPENKRSPIANRYPFLVVFIFGLLHGFGFAGVLGEIGLPASSTALALLLFNVGLELVQIAIVVVLVALGYFAKRWLPRLHQGMRYATIWLIGICASYWVVERTVML